MGPADALMLASPAVDFSFYIDDLIACARGTSADVESRLVWAVAHMRVMIEQELVCQIALEKSAVVGSSSGIVAAARRQLGRAAGGPSQVAANLGIDDRGGRGRASSGKATKLKGLSLRPWPEWPRWGVCGAR